MKKFLREIKILPSITTTNGADWETRVKEINELELEEIALFPTCLKEKERKNLYKLIEKSTIKSIPILHLRNDMELMELDYFIENYRTKIFCTHTKAEHPKIYDHSKYKEIICIENVYNFFDEEELKNIGGICLDLSHLENDRILHKDRFEQTTEVAQRYPILANHISAVKKSKFIDEEGELRYDNHYLEDLSELEYLKKYFKNYFSSFVVIELINNIKDQLKVKDYIINLLSKLNASKD